MESVASLALKEKEKKDALRKQIALLKSQLSDDEEPIPASPKRKSSNSTLLVPATPSPSEL